MSFLKKLFKKEEKEKLIGSYQEFWDWFLLHEKEFFNVVKKGDRDQISANFFDKIAPNLNELKNGIWYLTGMLNDTTADLILTADGEIKNFYFIEELVATAPKIDGWNFQALKPKTNIDNMAIKMAGFDFNSENLFFYANDSSDYPDEIDITIIHNEYSEENKNDIINGTYIFLDNYLGELNSLTLIDNVVFLPKEKAEKELIPFKKLESFITWREKEFIEKYEGVRKNTENDTFGSLEATLQSGNPLVAIVNTDLLKWDSKASHPWVLKFKIEYDGEANNGFPDSETYQFLDKIEEEINLDLKDFEGYLNIGRETAENIREVYFTCREFRKPCKIADKIIKKYTHKIKIEYEIYKDKYWRSFERYQS